MCKIPFHSVCFPLTSHAPSFCCLLRELSCSLNWQVIIGLNGIRSILIQRWRCSSVSLEWCSIMFIVEKAASLLYMEPNMAMCSGLLLSGLKKNTVYYHHEIESSEVSSPWTALSGPHLLGDQPIPSEEHQQLLEEVLCYFFQEPPAIWDKKWVLNEHGELLSKAVITFAIVYNWLNIKANKRRHLETAPNTQLLGNHFTL